MYKLTYLHKYIYMYMYMYMYIVHEYRPTYIPEGIPTCLQTYKCARTDVHTCMRTCAHTHTNTDTHTCTQMDTYTHPRCGACVRLGSFGRGSEEELEMITVSVNLSLLYVSYALSSIVQGFLLVRKACGRRRTARVQDLGRMVASSVTRRSIQALNPGFAQQWENFEGICISSRFATGTKMHKAKGSFTLQLG